MKEQLFTRAAAKTAEGEIFGTAAVFFRAEDPATEYGLWENVVERIAPGAFVGALERADDVRGLFNHDPNQLLGRTAAGTLELWIEDDGLHYRAKEAQTQVWRDVAEHLRRGDVDGSSFSFEVTEERWEKLEDGRTVRWLDAVKLYDVGPVTFPAYAATSAGSRADHPARRSFDAWQEHIERAAMAERAERERYRRELDRLQAGALGLKLSR